MLELWIAYIIVIFIIFSILGSFFEQIIFKKDGCDRNIKRITGRCPPFLGIYGAGVAILIIMKHNTPDWSMLTQTVVITAIIVAFECIVGILADQIYDGNGWTYKDVSCFWWCRGYNSLEVTAGWFVLVLLGLYIL